VAAEQSRVKLVELQASSKAQLAELEASRTTVNELREQLVNETKALEDASTKDKAEAQQTIEQLTKDLAAATQRCEELNAQLLTQMSDQGELANERERSIVEQGLLIEQLRKDQETREADLSHASAQIQQLREQAAMVEFWQGKANQAEMDLSATRNNLAQCQSARTDTDEVRTACMCVWKRERERERGLVC
jgi:chromosome segregation ATPase